MIFNRNGVKGPLFFFARVLGYDSLEIGQTVFVTGVAQFIAAPIAGRALRGMDMRHMLAGGWRCSACPAGGSPT
jgi:DHA2 family multidrug resistance protein